MGFEAKRIGDDISWAVVAIVAVLTLASLGLLYATAFVDPGFVPRDLDQEASEEGQVPHPMSLILQYVTLHHTACMDWLHTAALHP